MATTAKKAKRHDLIRISSADKVYLEECAKASGTDMAKYVRRLIAEDRRKQWFEEAKEAERLLRADKKVWETESRERKVWDAAFDSREKSE
jgi:hypothetical protein